METLLALALGIGLSAACGFRVFVPLLIVSVGTRAGYLEPAESFRWLGATPALVAFSAATAVELLGYMIPWVDHALDALALPLSAAAGTLLTASTLVEMGPLLQWSLGIVAGGGTAAAMRGTMAATRAGSTAVSGGVANPVLSVFEFLASVVATLLALVAPVLAVLVLLAVAAILIRLILWFSRRRRRIASGA